MGRQRNDCLGWTAWRRLQHRRQVLRLWSGSDTYANSFSKPNRDSYCDCNGNGDSNANGYSYSNSYVVTYSYT